MEARIQQILVNPNLNDLEEIIRYGKRTGSFEERMIMVSNGLISCLAKLLAQRENFPANQRLPAMAAIWDCLHWFVIIKDLEDPRERGPGSTIDICQRLGIFNYFHCDLVGNPDAAENIFGFISWCGQDEAAIPALMETKCHLEAIKHVKARDDLAQQGMAVIRALTTLEGSPRTIIRNDGGLEAVLPYLNDLRSTDNQVYRQAFRATSVISRLAGNDETGVGPQVLRGNPLLVETLVSFLDKVIEAGPTGLVYNMGVNPHLITMDILVIAASDANKPLLTSVIPVLAKALKARGDSNVKMVRDIVHIYLLLSFDKMGLAALQQLGKPMLSSVSRMIPPHDPECQASYDNLMQIVFSPPKSLTKTNSSSKLKSLMHKVLPKATTMNRRTLESTATTAVEEEEETAVEKHVMFSYNWGAKPIVLSVYQQFRARGIKCWIDDVDMGHNIVDSMAKAVEGACLVLVFLSQKYKESGNCRREFEYADTAGIPIVYIMAEPNFKPTGWIALIMGKALYVNCTSVEEAQGNIETLMNRVPVSSVKNNTAAATVPSTTSVVLSPRSTTANTISVEDMFKKLMESMEELKSTLAGVQEDVAELKKMVAKS